MISARLCLGATRATKTSRPSTDGTRFPTFGFLRKPFGKNPRLRALGLDVLVGRRAATPNDASKPRCCRRSAPLWHTRGGAVAPTRVDAGSRSPRAPGRAVREPAPRSPGRSVLRPRCLSDHRTRAAHRDLAPDPSRPIHGTHPSIAIPAQPSAWRRRDDRRNLQPEGHVT